MWWFQLFFIATSTPKIEQTFDQYVLMWVETANYEKSFEQKPKPWLFNKKLGIISNYIGFLNQPLKKGSQLTNLEIETHIIFHEAWPVGLQLVVWDGWRCTELS